MIQLLNNKTVIITGCNRGIGLSTLRLLAKHGAKIYAIVRNISYSFKKEIDNLCKLYKVEIMPVEVDLSDTDHISKILIETRIGGGKNRCHHK